MPYIASLDQLPSVKRYLTRIGAEARSMRSAVIREAQGTYKKDISVIRFATDGTIIADCDEHAPTEAEQQAIKKEFATVTFPKLKTLPTLQSLPDEVKGTDPDDIFEFRNAKGHIVMLQVRRVGKDGIKYYLPYTFWDDGQWRRVEPEGSLPLWGLDKVKDHTTVFIHEGAKAARNIQRMVAAETVDQKTKLKAHPWGQELSAAAHVGWIGGALSPHRTDWEALAAAGVKTAYIVSDNDQVGIAAVAQIAFHLRCATFHVQFTHEWPASFDLGDDFPPDMFSEVDGKRRYVGPAFRACLHPATWATDLITDEEGKSRAELREHFKDMWAYIEDADLFICKPIPSILRQERILNNMLAAFSHSSETSKLILKAYNGRTTSLTYRPDRPEQVITQGSSAAINLHIPTYIRPEPGDPTPFLDYLAYMFPVDFERHEVTRWVATLIARPDIRMEYGLLLISEAQGIGKTTLGSLILAPLVGTYNVGWPREHDIVNSDFNDWVANKRLVIVNEIYSGQSWKAYHSLKSLITDKEITVNQKFQRPYLVENWCHIFACSNSMQALKMEADDRRWYYPTVTEERWPREKFVALREWLASGGLSIIKHWAEGFEDYVEPGQRARLTARKKEMIEGSRSEAQAEAASIAEALCAMERPAALAMKDIVGAIRSGVQGKVFDSDYELRKTMAVCGAHIVKDRIRVHGRLQYVIANGALKRLLLNSDNEQELVSTHLIKPADLLEPSL